MFVGDSMIEKLRIGKEAAHPERMFKIARPASTIRELTEDIEFFSSKLHRNINKVILQLGYQDFRAGKSELLKRDILHLLHQMEEKSVEVVLSGPIPYPSMTNIAFSRMYAFHDWVNQNLSGVHDM